MRSGFAGFLTLVLASTAMASESVVRWNDIVGVITFEVDGLVINGTAFSGTPGPVTQVEGTLVCNAGLACSACARLRSLSSDRALRWV